MAETTDNNTTPTAADLPDFADASAQRRSTRSRRSLFTTPKQAQLGILGVYESADGDGHVRVRLDTGETVRARLVNFPTDFQLEPGDELGVVATAGELQTVSNVHRTVQRGDRVEFYTVNRDSGALRLLHRRQPPATDHEDPAPAGIG